MTDIKKPKIKDDEFLTEAQVREQIDDVFKQKLAHYIQELLKDRNFDDVLINGIINIFNERESLRKKFATRLRFDVIFGGIKAMFVGICTLMLLSLPYVKYIIELISKKAPS